MLIRDLEKKTGLPRDTIRFYEKEGLLKDCLISRRENNYKEYSTDVVERLVWIKTLRRFSFSLEEIKNLSLSDESDPKKCEPLIHSVNDKLQRIDEEILQLQHIKLQLDKVKKNCGPSCTLEGKIPTCLRC
ncbi:MerR family transcriptional regulator [Leptospira gomenensis]|uniref:MerR family transcriptional regulator n=1 Tax=Leptospira gomenensis TaxID=2484974 RepID=A0A5F1Y8D3_9LEPT|nr:MerR family transcriptional regulator [Leptospira gomenensis]TGK29424.1 MerR family transcriptional regulator [Leptospira gomenensis]TGK33673.1 MerR family transcriptional regulator [Leptospira gomenensis]TGK44914.1 MerR family transcriptional regulator [Leptospira gomenensis]TGK64535.1 MerR family transcriptional regulator [Leptospira gomenensis]